MVADLIAKKLDKHGMRRVLAKNVKLSLKALLIKGTILGFIAISIMDLEDDERLYDDRLLATRTRPKDVAISRDLSPSQDTQSKARSNPLKDQLMFLTLDGIVGIHEDVAHGVLSDVRELGSNIPLDLTPEEFVRNTGHDTSTITIAGISTYSTSIDHGTKQDPRIRDNEEASLNSDFAD